LPSRREEAERLPPFLSLSYGLALLLLSKPNLKLLVLCNVQNLYAHCQYVVIK